MSEVKNKKINLSGLQLGKGNDSESSEASTLLNLSEKMDNPRQSINNFPTIKQSEDEQITGKNEPMVQKISLAGMKQKRMGKSSISKDSSEELVERGNIHSEKNDHEEILTKLSDVQGPLLEAVNINVDATNIEKSKMDSNLLLSQANKEEMVHDYQRKENIEKVPLSVIQDNTKADNSKKEEKTKEEPTSLNQNNTKVPINSINIDKERVKMKPISLNAKRKEITINETEEHKQGTDKHNSVEINGKTLQTQNNDKKSLFSNYTSDFEKNEGNIIDKLKKLSKKPQTRTIFVLGLIFITVGGIGGLFIIDPKRHSVFHYKEVLNDFYIKHTKSNTDIQINGNIKDTKSPENIWKNTSIIKDGYRISIKTQLGVNGVTLYKFNGLDFNTMDDLNNEIDLEINKLKTDKVKKFLLNPNTASRSNKNNGTPDEKYNTVINDKKKNVETIQRKTTLQLLQERK